MADQQLKILIVSMNCADVVLKPADIAAIAQETGFNGGTYDLVVVGEQETKGSKDHSYIANRLGALKPADYAWGADDSGPKGKSRVTLTGTMGTGKHQSLGVIWKKSIDKLIVPFDEARRNTGKVKGYSKKGWHTGKGGVVLNVGIGNNELSFASCHLNDESEQKRVAELNNITGAMPPAALTSFLMGDLNFRLKCNRLKAGGDPKKRLDYEALAPDAFFAMLLNKAERTKFMNMNDPLTNGDVKLPGWTLPKPDFFPTYKRVQGVALAAAANAATLKAAYWTKCGGPKADKKLPYSDGDVTSVMDKRPGDYGIGWLDRFAHKGAVSDVTFEALHNITVSDHTPIMMTCKVKVTYNP